MPRTISSQLTFFYKFILPVLFLLSSVNMLVQMLRGQFFKEIFPPVAIFVLIFAAWIALALWCFVRLKKVSLDDDFLYVSDYRTESRIPLEEIVNVTEVRWINPFPVTIHLRSPSEFGTKIVFAPTYRMFALFSPHPIVEELKVIARAKSPTGFLVDPSRRGLFY